MQKKILFCVSAAIGLDSSAMWAHLFLAWKNLVQTQMNKKHFYKLLFLQLDLW